MGGAGEPGYGQGARGGHGQADSAACSFHLLPPVGELGGRWGGGARCAYKLVQTNPVVKTSGASRGITETRRLFTRSYLLDTVLLQKGSAVITYG
ncbi:hypothetical protein GCM10010394_05600 [Streptomyces crystallinus]|uniref:Uncharacterized protein n=1 Tax=Streptomyces crystallinus TaxID=68191 RepID=A0ABN1F1D9_9ACTN